MMPTYVGMGKPWTWCPSTWRSCTWRPCTLESALFFMFCKFNYDNPLTTLLTYALYILRIFLKIKFSVGMFICNSALFFKFFCWYNTRSFLNFFMFYHSTRFATGFLKHTHYTYYSSVHMYCILVVLTVCEKIINKCFLLSFFWWNIPLLSSFTELHLRIVVKPSPNWIFCWHNWIFTWLNWLFSWLNWIFSWLNSIAT